MPACTTNYGLQFYASGDMVLTAFLNADWGFDLGDKKSFAIT